MTRTSALISAVLALCLAAPASADPALDTFAREVSRVEGVRAVKELQRSYAQYGLCDEVGAFFADDAVFTFDGQVLEAETPPAPPGSSAPATAMAGRA